MAVDQEWHWVAWLIFGIGGLILAGGLALGWGSLRYVLHAERADGEVIEIRREGDRHAPVVHFRLPGGQTQQVVTDLESGAPDFAVGDKVAILYMPQDPGDFRIDTFDRLWSSALLVTLFACFWLMFGAIAWALPRDADLFVVGERAFAVIAAAAVVIGVFALSSALGLYNSGTRAEGTVVRVSYAPVVRFSTRGGRLIEFHGRGGSGTSYAAGDRVTVIYDPGKPMHARIVSFLDLWLPSVVCFVVAILFGGAAGLSRWFRD